MYDIFILRVTVISYSKQTSPLAFWAFSALWADSHRQERLLTISKMRCNGLFMIIFPQNFVPFLLTDVYRRAHWQIGWRGPWRLCPLLVHHDASKYISQTPIKYVISSLWIIQHGRASFLTIPRWLRALRFLRENYKIYRVSLWLFNSVREVSNTFSKKHTNEFVRSLTLTLCWLYFIWPILCLLLLDCGFDLNHFASHFNILSLALILF